MNKAFPVLLLALPLTAVAQSDATLRASSSTLWATRNLTQNTNLLSMTNGQVLMMVGTNIVATNAPSADISAAVAKAGDTMTGALEVPDLTVTGTGAYDTMIVTNMNLLTPLAGTPFDLRISGAVVNETITNNSNGTLVSNFTGSGRRSLQSALDAGTNNFFLPAGKWSFYQGADSTLTKDAGVIVDRDVVIRGVPGETILDFGRQSGTVQNDQQVEFIHMGGRFELRDLIITNCAQLIVVKYKGRDISKHGEIVFDNVRFDGASPLSGHWTGGGAPRFAATTTGGVFSWADAQMDVWRTNLFAAKSWTADTGWTDNGDGTWTYAQPAAANIIASVGATNGLARVTTSGAHGLNAGDWVTIDASNNTFDITVPARVWSAPDTTSFTYYITSLATVADTAATGTITRAGVLKLASPGVTFRPGDLVRYRMQLESKTAGNGPRLYVDGSFSPPINRAKSHKISGIQRTASAINGVRYTQITVAGAHAFKAGDVLDVNDTAHNFYNTNTFVVLRTLTSGALICTPEPGTTMTDNASASMTVGHGWSAENPAPVSNVARSEITSGWEVTVTTSTNDHRLKPGMVVSMNISDVGRTNFNGIPVRVRTVPTTNTFTYRDYRPLLGTVSSTPVTTGSVLQSFIEEPMYPIGFDGKVELVPPPDFAGTIGELELYAANFTDVVLKDSKFNMPIRFAMNGRSGIQAAWAFRKFIVDNCEFTGGDQTLYTGNADSRTAYFEPAQYFNGPTITRTQFRGIGSTPNIDSRGAYLFGANISISDSVFAGVSFPGVSGISRKGSRDTLYIAADGATIERTKFLRSGGNNMIVVKGAGGWDDASYAMDGTPAARGITFRECIFDGRGSETLVPFYVDAKPTFLKIDNCEIFDYRFSTLLADVSATAKFSRIELINSEIRNISAPTHIQAQNAEGAKVVYENNEVRCNELQYPVTAYSPLLVRVVNNRFGEYQLNSSRYPVYALANLFNVVAGYNVGSVVITGNTQHGSPNELFYGYLYLPASGLTLTNVTISGNRMRVFGTGIYNETGNTIGRLTMFDNLNEGRQYNIAERPWGQAKIMGGWESAIASESSALLKPAGGTTFGGYGDSLTDLVGTASAVVPTATTPAGINLLTTAATTGTDLGAFGNVIRHFGQPLAFTTTVALPETNNVRYWFGLTDTNATDLAALQAPTYGNLIAWRYDDTLTNKWCLVSRGSGTTSNNTSVVVSTDPVTLSFVWSGDGVIRGYINGALVVAKDSSVVADANSMPSTSAACRFVAYGESLANENKNLKIFRVYHEGSR